MAQTPTRLKLTRDQLASFLKDFEQIKQFEALFGVVDEMSSVTVIELINQAAVGVVQANKALALITALAKLVQPQLVATRATVQLKSLPDVLIDQPQARHTLIYDATIARWLNDFVDLNDLGDVAITTPADGDILIYNSGTWVNGQIAPGANIDVSVAAGVATISTVGATGSLTGAGGEIIDFADGVITTFTP